MYYILFEKWWETAQYYKTNISVYTTKESAQLAEKEIIDKYTNEAKAIYDSFKKGCLCIEDCINRDLDTEIEELENDNEPYDKIIKCIIWNEYCFTFIDEVIGSSKEDCLLNFKVPY